MLRIKKRATTDDDTRLVSACKQGDMDAFDALVRKYQKKMFNIAFRITGDHDDACETVQEAFLSACRGVKGFRGDSCFSTWLTAITVNLARNRLKQMQGRRCREVLSLDDPIRTENGCMAADPPSDAETAQEQLERQELRRQVWECIGYLHPDFRSVLVLRDMQDFSYEEIGGMLKLALGTVKSRISRAREAIRDCLKSKLGDIL
ncbi:MAG TPA: sigma-70 family RNA polymerase sigma factor [Geobacteraceae bacterium]|nr:sigma-70 family RNA polymerase sigma factor [Geobacteraceae bacterium]